MAVVVRDVPPGYDWGWYSREDPRMHLQVVSRKHRHLSYKVWLELDGGRTIEPLEGIPTKILTKLRAEIELRRPSIEAEWVTLMITLDWLRLRVRNSLVTLMAYPDTTHRFERTIDLRDYLAADVADRIRSKDVQLNAEYAVIEVFPSRAEGQRPWIQIPPLLWQ